MKFTEQLDHYTPTCPQEEKDREIVEVEEPEPEPEPEVEEPEPEPEPQPEPKAPSPVEEPVSQAPKTGDESHLMVLAFLCILSCALLLTCVKISCKAKYK